MEVKEKKREKEKRFHRKCSRNVCANDSKLKQKKKIGKKKKEREKGQI